MLITMEMDSGMRFDEPCDEVPTPACGDEIIDAGRTRAELALGLQTVESTARAAAPTGIGGFLSARRRYRE